MNPYLFDVSAAMSAVPPQQSLETSVPFGPPAPPAAAPQAPPAASTPWAPQDPLAGTVPAPAPNRTGQGVMQGYDPLAPDAPPPPPAGPSGAPAISMASAGGYVPAHEVSRLGPSQWAALNSMNATQEQAIGAIATNHLGQSVRDEAVYAQQAMDARLREEAAANAASSREEEMRQRAHDFDRQAKALSSEKLDPGRLWASKSAPQKVATFISIALGGFLSGARGGENLAWNRVTEEIDKDVRAQETSFNMRRAGLDASHTAYGMAMQRYQSADAARAFARVAAMDSVAAEVQRQQAQAKGTDAKNRAIGALTELEQARADQIMKGIAFVQPSASEARYRVANRLGTYTAKEIDQQQIAKEEERGFELSKIDRHNDGEIRKEEAKETAKAGSDEPKHLSTAMQQAGIPAARRAAEEARQAILATPQTYTERVANLTVPVSNVPAVKKAAFGGKVTERDQAWEIFKSQQWKQIYGNVTAPEEARANAAFSAANDDASKLKAIEITEKILSDAEENLRRGISPRGNQAYDERKVTTGGAKPITGVASGFKPYGSK